MNTFELVFDWLVSASLRASCIAVAVLIIQQVLKPWLPASWRYALWLPVVLVLVLPVLPSTPWSLDFAAEARKGETEVAVQGKAGKQVLEISPTDMAAVGAAVSVNWKKVGMWVWLLGACGGLALTVGAYLRTLHKHCVRPERLNNEVRALVEKEAELLGLRHVPEVRIIPASHSPAVAGLLRPLLLLPVNFPEGFTRFEARLIIRHELTHVRRFDLPVNWLMCVLQCLHWFNPVLWLAFARMRADRELTCDAAVLCADAADSRADYGHALLKLQNAGPLMASNLALVGIFGRSKAIRGRIVRIADFKPAQGAWNAVAAVVLAAVTFLGVTQAQPLEAPRLNWENYWQDKLDRIIIPSVVLKDASLDESIDFLRAKARELDTAEPNPKLKGVNILVRRSEEWSAARISLNLTNVPLGEALRYVAGLGNMEVAVRPAYVQVTPTSTSTPGKPKGTPPLSKPVSEAGKKIQKKMQEIILPRVAFNDMPLQECVAFFTAKSREFDLSKGDSAQKGVNFVLAKNEAKPGARITLDLVSVPLSEAVRYVAELADMDVTVGSEEVLLTPKLTRASAPAAKVR